MADSGPPGPVMSHPFRQLDLSNQSFFLLLFSSINMSFVTHNTTNSVIHTSDTEKNVNGLNLLNSIDDWVRWKGYCITNVLLENQGHRVVRRCPRCFALSSSTTWKYQFPHPC